METMLVIIGLFLCASVVLAITANIFYVASQGLVDLFNALGGFFRLMKRG
ncbi:hypothetical protein [Desulfovibrio desulfuricans]|nr:hypothetical protein [Desulfovibrio desulfuricans]MBT9749859.1 hypothetical protein [Desulfovibrio desulfuricans]